VKSADPVFATHALGVSTAVTAIVAGWFALTFAITLGALVLHA